MRVSRHTEKPSAFLQAPSVTAWLSAYFSRMHTVRKLMTIVAEKSKNCNMFCKFFENSSFNPISALLRAHFHKKLHLFDKFLLFRRHYLFFTVVSPLAPHRFFAGLCPASPEYGFLCGALPRTPPKNLFGKRFFGISKNFKNYYCRGGFHIRPPTYGGGRKRPLTAARSSPGGGALGVGKYVFLKVFGSLKTFFQKGFKWGCRGETPKLKK